MAQEQEYRPKTPHEETVAIEVARNTRSATETLKIALIVGAVAGVAVLGREGMEALQGNQDRCAELRLEAHQNGQPASRLSFIADNGVEVRCY
jgi:hypothetical protein